jgi:hypothetical protein
MAVVDQRLEEIENLIVQGATINQVVKYGEDKWSLGERQIRRYIKKVFDRFNERGPQGQLEEMQLAVFRKALAGGKTSAANGALDRIAKTMASKALDAEEHYKSAGPVPMTDTLQGAAHMQRIMLLSAEEIIKDKSLTPAQRRDELRKTAARVSALVSFDDMEDARKRLKGHQEEKAKEDSDVKTEEIGDDDDDDTPVFVASPRGR